MSRALNLNSQEIKVENNKLVVTLVWLSQCEASTACILCTFIINQALLSTLLIEAKTFLVCESSSALIMHTHESHANQVHASVDATLYASAGVDEQVKIH